MSWINHVRTKPRMNRLKRNRGENTNRLREILEVLKDHEIVKGLSPEKLRLILEDLGPTFIKIGQVMSMRQDMIPAEYCEELTKLRTDVKPMDFDEIKSVIESEYGKSMDKVFTEFDKAPLGSASIAQAHYAVLKSGLRVVVKVQRRGIYDIMSRDIALMRKASGILKIAGGTADTFDFNMILDEMWFVTQQEMNFLTEAANADEFNELNSEVVYVSCPQIEHKYTTSKVLVMEYIDGIEIDEKDNLREMGYDTEEIGLKLAENYVKQVIDDGYFHADPHPGNLRIRDGQIVWIDMGMMGRLSTRDKSLLRTGVRAIAENDVAELKNVLLTMAVYKGKINHARLYTDLDDLLTKYGTVSMGDMDVGMLMNEILILSKAHNMSMPKGVTMLCRGVLTIQGVVADISPDTNIVAIMINHMSGDFLRNLDIDSELNNIRRDLYNSGRKAVDIPGQLSDILKMTIKGQTKMNLELIGSEEPLSAIDKMVNKLVVCIINAALLIGSSLICTTDMKPKILGIPALGTIGYGAALILGGWLLWSIRRKK